MNSEQRSYHSYLQLQYDDQLDHWNENRDGHNTYMLGWAIIKLEESIRQNHVDDDEPKYPKGYFTHLNMVGGDILKTLPVEILEAALHVEQSMTRHYGLARDMPVAIFKEHDGAGVARIVSYFGNGQFTTHNSMRACIEFLNDNYGVEIPREVTDMERFGIEYGNADSREKVDVEYQEGGGGRAGIVAVWNLIEREGQ